MKKLSDIERSAFFVASRDRRTTMPFDPQTTLNPVERSQILALLGNLSAAMPTASASTGDGATYRNGRPPVGGDLKTSCSLRAKPRQLSPLEAARLRKNVLALVPLASGPEVFRQVLWSLEEGALRRFEPRLGMNIALKKIREGAWSRPNRMPPNWLRAGALAETCSAA